MRSFLIVALLAAPALADNHEPPAEPLPPPADPPGQICVDCPPQARTTTILRVPRIEEYTEIEKRWVQIDCEVESAIRGTTPLENFAFAVSRGRSASSSISKAFALPTSPTFTLDA